MLLTERVPDLTHYPGQLVFPGGAAEINDDGPVSTALRETAEETGLNPSSVCILGTLPAIALTDSGFLLTPVLAWSAQLAFIGPTNPAEVSALISILLPQKTKGESPEMRFTSHRGAPVNSKYKTLGSVTDLLIDLLAGMLARVGNPGATTLTTIENPYSLRITDPPRLPDSAANNS